MALRPRENVLRGGFLVRPNSDNFSEDYFIPFLFNPRPVEFQDQHDYAEHKVPGRADPFIQYLNGQTQNINIELIVEQERIDEFRITRINVNPSDSKSQDDAQQFTFRSPTFEGTNTYSPRTAMEYVELIQSLGYPRQNTTSFAKKSPPKVLFVFGQRLISVRLRRVNTSEEEHREDLSLEYAKIQVSLMRDDPLFPRIYRKPGTSATEFNGLPSGISIDDISDNELVRRPPGPGYVWR